MKKFLFVPLALFPLCFAAQNTFQLMTPPDGTTVIAPNTVINLATQPETNVKYTFDLKNTSASTQTYTARRYDILLNTSNSQDNPVATAYFCFAGNCYGQPTFISPYNLVLTPNQRASDIPSDYQMLIADLDETTDIGQSIVRYTFKNVNNAADSIQVTIDYNNAIWLGVKENTKSVSAFRLMPNPSSNGLVSIKSDNDFSKVEVINQLGSVVLNKAVTSLNGRVDLDLSAFAAGVYYVRINNGDRTSTQKLVLTGH